jgi:hypothetical protein
MLTRERAEEILRTLATLPPDKVAEVQDFALFLKQQCERESAPDDSDAWTEEDLRDLTAAALEYAERTSREKAAEDG